MLVDSTVGEKAGEQRRKMRGGGVYVGEIG